SPRRRFLPWSCICFGKLGRHHDDVIARIAASSQECQRRGTCDYHGSVARGNLGECIGQSPSRTHERR
ncbi:MAG TPA: hypothetical protein PLV85_08730, partial [Polyangiaceae bacterium]|nr:hypothetical protein [Polyangiaceae bacterium]